MVRQAQQGLDDPTLQSFWQAEQGAGSSLMGSARSSRQFCYWPDVQTHSSSVEGSAACPPCAHCVHPSRVPDNVLKV